MRAPLLALLALFSLSGCQSAYYATMEKVGIHKRDILADRVEAAGEAQQDAQKQFKDALEHFRAVVKVEGSEDLEKRYDELSSQYEDSEKAAKEVSDRIDAVQDVAEALFEEWQGELDQYSSPSLRAASAHTLADTKRRYQSLLKAMRKAEAKMPPVLAKFHDQVLFLKHNLNARAIGSLKGELGSIEKQVDSLIKEMQRAVNESERFIQNLNQQG
ncbi:DUF2959 domain-containing protein [Gallaecimonas kandeliae]|uniref:DUF2959 domain-containing protein n=1 Tax=Gallaecimonas kandeliae TaxID=3029055 RepID=UPI00264805B7|nr:DUF2959 domain-containing protein [Gallaecimonas kandeliae]WKE65592.1 DUF2959 domain-containing protein [Gallaecimonas kandeliae]